MQTSPESICRFGIARKEITPPVGIYHRMWGAALHDLSTGVHRPLLATACCFASSTQDSTGDDCVLLALDHCVLGEPEIDKILAPLMSQGIIDKSRVQVVFSHTHAAGLMLLDRASQPGGDGIEPYLDSMAETIATIVKEAIANSAPATLTFAAGSCNLAADRDMWDEDSEQWVCGFHPDGFADDTVLVGRAVGEDGATIASFVNYACHPTTLAWDNQQVSPDYPGAMREVVERATNAPCVFLQGASADLGPVRGYVGDVAQADQNGRQLGYAALSTWESLHPPRTEFHYEGAVVSGATLGTWADRPASESRLQELRSFIDATERLEIPYRSDIPTEEDVTNQRSDLLEQEQAAKAAGDSELAGELRARVERLTRARSRFKLLPPGHYPLELSVWRMGEVVWVFVPGEPYQSLQVEIRERFPDLAIVVAAISGAWGPSYLPPRHLYGQGIYQESIAVLEAGTLENITTKAIEMIEATSSTPSAA